MPQFAFGGVAQFTLNGVNLSQYLSSVTLDTETDEVEIDLLGGAAQQVLRGAEGNTLEFEGYLHETAMDAIETAKTASATAPVPWILQPQGAAAGEMQYDGDCVVLNISRNMEATDPGTFTVSCRVSGGYTYGDVA